MAIDIDSIIKSAEQGIAHLAQQTLSDYTTQAVADGTDILNAIKEDLAGYTEQLAVGEIDQDTFNNLIQNDVSLVKMTALEQAGLAEAALDKFVSGVESIIITAAVSAIP